MEFKTLTSVLVLSTLLAGSEAMSMDPTEGDKETATKALPVAPTPTTEENSTSTPTAVAPESQPPAPTEEQLLSASARYPDLVEKIANGHEQGADENAKELGKKAENELALKVLNDVEDKDKVTQPPAPLTENQKSILSRLFGGWAPKTVASSAPAETTSKETTTASSASSMWGQFWPWAAKNRGATPSVTTPPIVPVTESNGEVALTPIAPAPTETTDKPASSASPVIRDEIRELDDLTSTVSETYRKLKESNKLIQYILEQSGYKHWDKLTPNEQDDFVAKISQ